MLQNVIVTIKIYNWRKHCAKLNEEITVILMAEAIKSFTFWDTSDTKNNILLSASECFVV